MREGDVSDVDEGKARFVRLIKVTPGDDGAALASGGPGGGVFKEGEVSKQRETTWVKEEKEQKGKTRKRMRDGLGGGGEYEESKIISYPDITNGPYY